MSSSDSKTLLEQLDSLPQLRSFDAFPKTQPIYTQRSSRGGLLTLLLSLILFSLVWSDFRSYLYGEHAYDFSVDPHIGHEMQINVDLTVAMKCHYLTIDVRDAVGDRLHVGENVFSKDGTTFEIGHAGRLDSVPHPELSAQELVRKGKRKTRNALSGLVRRPGKYADSRKHAFAQTTHKVDDGPACRIYGSLDVKKVTGNLHITTLGHGYASFEHTNHELMNLSHVIHEFSFGPYFPDIAQPLDSSVEVTSAHFHIFQYFVSIVPTLYISRSNQKLHTNQYSVTDYTRVVEHGMGVPGIFIKYDVEPLTMIIHQRATPFWRFLVQLAGVAGGIVVCARFGFRAANRAVRETRKHILKQEDDDEVDGGGLDGFRRRSSAEAYASGMRTRPGMPSPYGSGYGSSGVGGGAPDFGMRPGKTDGYAQPRMVHPIPGQQQQAQAGAGYGTTSPMHSPPVGGYQSPPLHQGQYSPHLSQQGGQYGGGAAGAGGGGGTWGELGGAAAGMASRAWSAVGSAAATATAAAGGGGGGRAHRHTESLQQKLDSEEGRAY
ncbi:hypothetical protein OC846_001452 [Tilletia horrida]|uniref:DUF1692-domain-containing protein n=1 Tax=Tilletia horrida TaxID=155126 RepID=A0AAN6JTH8_9BASI|nr:hypothetical protein OC845_002526 [Tilletia horrida]KAK0556016.1 hypothetical protein OC846_001452 [Tilletia horrida]KAK0569020.1 hypothetical protein OC861_001361 [Tilletia horrida]